MKEQVIRERLGGFQYQTSGPDGLTSVRCDVCKTDEDRGGDTMAEHLRFMHPEVWVKAMQADPLQRPSYLR